MRKYIELRNKETGENIAQGEISPTRARLIIKEYAKFGYYLEQVA